MSTIDALQQRRPWGRPLSHRRPDWLIPPFYLERVFEPGGYHWSNFASLVEAPREHHLVAADVVELAPQLDTSGISSVLAAKVTRSLLLLLGHNRSDAHQPAAAANGCAAC